MCHECQDREDEHQSRQVQSESSEEVITLQEVPTNTHRQFNRKKKRSPKKADKYNVHGQKQKQFVQDLMSKQSERKAQIAKNAHKKMIRHFVTEYQRQFGKSNAKKAEKNKAKSGESDIAIIIATVHMLANVSIDCVLRVFVCFSHLYASSVWFVIP